MNSIYKKRWLIAGLWLLILSFSSRAHGASLGGNVWNHEGWIDYQHDDFILAEQAFMKQLQISPKSVPALWGLANCYANNQVRDFARARTDLKLLTHAPIIGPHARALLSQLPPNAVDPFFHANDPVTYEDAIAIALSYRMKMNKVL